MKLRYVTLAIIIIFLICLVLFPNIVYDRFLWKYFIGPVVADAVGHPVEYHGVKAYEGYTIVSEIVYGAFLVLFIYLLYLFFEKYSIKVDLKFILCSLPFLLYGSFARVLEDAGIFQKPLAYFFISPVIYIQIGIFFFLSILYGLKFKDAKTFAYSLALKDIGYTLLYIFIFTKYCRYNIHPIIFALFSLFAFYVYYKQEKKDYNASMLSFGLLTFSSAFFIFIYFSLGNANFLPEILIAPFLAFIISFLLYIIGYSYEILHNKMNALLVFSHMLDGLTTYFAVVNPLNFKIEYGEKHPLPEFLMKRFHGIGYPLLKLFVILGIIYVIDDLKMNLKNTIKFFILFLGLSPGLRDLLRILIGV